MTLILETTSLSEPVGGVAQWRLRHWLGFWFKLNPVVVLGLKKKRKKKSSLPSTVKSSNQTSTFSQQVYCFDGWRAAPHVHFLKWHDPAGAPGLWLRLCVCIGNSSFSSCYIVISQHGERAAGHFSTRAFWSCWIWMRFEGGSHRSITSPHQTITTDCVSARMINWAVCQKCWTSPLSR